MDILRLIALAELLLVPGAIIALITSGVSLYWLLSDRRGLQAYRTDGDGPLLGAVGHHLAMEVTRFLKISLVLISAVITFYLTDMLTVDERRLVIRIAFNGIIWMMFYGAYKTFRYWRDLRKASLAAVLAREPWDQATERRAGERRR